VLLINLGTPDAPNAGAIRRYLAQFLKDPRVVELPRVLWLPILYGFVLPFRPARLAHAYAQIWTDAGSPLLHHTRRLGAALA
jgi:ferrochelatase